MAGKGGVCWKNHTTLLRKCAENLFCLHRLPRCRCFAYSRAAERRCARFWSTRRRPSPRPKPSRHSGRCRWKGARSTAARRSRPSASPTCQPPTAPRASASSETLLGLPNGVTYRGLTASVVAEDCCFGLALRILLDCPRQVLFDSLVKCWRWLPPEASASFEAFIGPSLSHNKWRRSVCKVNWLCWAG